MHKIPPAAAAGKSTVRPQLRQELTLQSEKCIECKLCRRECLFLQKYGSPRQIAATYDPDSPRDQLMAFECSLCQLCAAVCPVKINPAAMFLEMRREAVSRGVQDFAGYGVILNYEKRGTSRRYSHYGLPAECDTILFPGCALPGTRPDKVKALFAHLRQTIPRLGIVLDCCTKPSHDLGRESHFQAMFGEMREYLLQHGVKKVLVACPNCYRVFKQYGEPLQVETVYEFLAATSLPETADIAATVTVHDPCSTRNDEQIHAVIRRLAAAKSLTIQEMKHHGVRTLCCGEGGSVGCVNADFSRGWGKRRQEEAGGERILTYCAGCASFLGRLNPTSHILDLLFEPGATLAGKVKISRAPWTYLNRLLLKSYFKKQINAAASRERAFMDKNAARGGMLKRLFLLLALAAVAVFVAVR
ncbi:MAG: (Fe-S)-binding protein [Desulfurivibrio sp.]|jgi:Fe-S oxidoreductase|nr:MAG: (Fe-S)-binding protein [Desulfurivibrio sp.]